MSAAGSKGSVFSLAGASKSGLDTDKAVSEYSQMFSGDADDKAALAKRNEQCAKGKGKEMVDRFYTVVTDFYEYGWGPSFHFAATRNDETYATSIRTHEYYLALRAGFKPGDKVVDMGCGIAGPARNIARFARCHVTGVTINEYQVKRARQMTEQMGLSDLVNVVQGDFMKLPFADGALDGAFAIEATCHTADKLGVYGEAYRVLKPGAYFVGYEWCTTPKYNPDNKEHRRIRHGIEVGNGLPETVATTVVDKALKDVGFELIEAMDMVERSEYPWYQPLDASWSWSGLRQTRLGMGLTWGLVYALETLRLAPKGSTHVQNVLVGGARHLVEGGKTGIYTPMYFFLARKPL